MFRYENFNKSTIGKKFCKDKTTVFKLFQLSLLHFLINNFEQGHLETIQISCFCDSQLQMQNQVHQQVFVFDEEEEPDLSLKSGEEIPPSFNPRLPHEMELVDQSDGESDSVEIVDPFTSTNPAPRQPEAPNHHHPAQIHQPTSNMPEPTTALVFPEENALSLPTPQQQSIKKQSESPLDVKIFNAIHILPQENEQEHPQIQNSQGRLKNRRLNQNARKNRFQDISDHSSISHQKLANQAGHVGEAKILTPNLFSRSEHEQQQNKPQRHKTEEHHNEIEHKEEIVEELRMSKVAKIKKNILPPLSEQKIQVQILNSSATQMGMGAQSSTLVDPRTHDKMRNPYMQSYAHMITETQQQPKLSWVKMSVPPNKTSRCIFARQKLCCSNFYNPEYSVLLKDNTFLLTAKKEFGHINSHYNISINEKQFDSESKGHIGYLKGNFFGTRFDLYEKKSGKDDLVCTITYKAELSCSPAFRVMEIYIRNRGLAYADLFGTERDADLNLQELYQMGENASLGHIIKLINKKPEWSELHDCYVLNLRGKSRMGSVKNVVLIDEKNPKVDSMLFCKIQKHKFHLQINNPLSPFIAMGILMSSFDFKLSCQ